MTAWCHACGASERMFHSRREHEQACRAGVPVIWTSTNPHKPVASSTHTGGMANDVANARDMANADVANKASIDIDVANDSAATIPGRKRASPTYRYRNPDKRRLYMRDLMRRRRAAQRTARAA